MSIAGIETEMSGHTESGLGPVHAGAESIASGWTPPSHGNIYPSAQPGPESFRSSWQSQFNSLLLSTVPADNPPVAPEGLTETSALTALATQLLPAETPTILSAPGSSTIIRLQSRLSAKPDAAQVSPALSGHAQNSAPALPAQIPASHPRSTARQPALSEAAESLEIRDALHSTVRKPGSARNTSREPNLVEKAHDLTGFSLESASLILPAPVANPVPNTAADAAPPHRALSSTQLPEITLNSHESEPPLLAHLNTHVSKSAHLGSLVFSANANGFSQTSVPPIAHNKPAPPAQSTSEIEESALVFSASLSPIRIENPGDREIPGPGKSTFESPSRYPGPAHPSIPAPEERPVCASEPAFPAPPRPQVYNGSIGPPDPAPSPTFSPYGSVGTVAQFTAVTSPVTFVQGPHIQNTTPPGPRTLAQNQTRSSSAITVPDSTLIRASISEAVHQVRTSPTNPAQYPVDGRIADVSVPTTPARISNLREPFTTEVLGQREPVPIYRAVLSAKDIVATQSASNSIESASPTAKAQPTAEAPAISRISGLRPLVPDASMPVPTQPSILPLGRELLPVRPLDHVLETETAVASSVQTIPPRQLSGLPKPTGPVVSRTSHESVTISTPTHLIHPLQEPASNPTGDAPVLQRDLSGTQGATAPTSEEVRSSTSTAPPARDPFTTLDSGTALGTPAWVHAGPRRAEAGFQDPALGWVGVRAGASGGRIHATLVPGSSDAAQALDGHLAGLHSYLADVHSPVKSLTLAAPESRESSLTPGQHQGHGMNQGTNQNAGQGNARESSSQPEPATPITVSASSSDQTGTTVGSGNQSPETHRRSGAHISVIA